MLVGRSIAALMGASLVALWSVCGVVVAQTPANPLVEQMVAERAAVLVSLSRRFEAREQETLDRIAVRSREVGAALRAREIATSERARLQREMSQIANDCTELTRRLGASHPAFAADLAAYRAAVTSLATSPDPRRLAALERYALGDRGGALSVLTQIQEAETRAVAAGWREIGALALDMRDRGERTTGQASEVFAQSHRLDPSRTDTTQQLVALLSQERRYREALAVIDAHKRTGPSGQALAETLRLQGRVLFNIGESRRAQPILREAIAEYDRLRRQTPTDTDVLVRWLDARGQLRNAISSGGGPENEAGARQREQNDLIIGNARALNSAPAFGVITEPETLYELTRLNCSAYMNRSAVMDLAAGLLSHCMEGAAALRARHPNTFFAQQAEFYAIRVQLSVAQPGSEERRRRTVEMVQLGQRLSDRDPDDVVLISTLAVEVQRWVRTERQPDGPASSAVRDVVLRYERALERGHFSPRDGITLIALYGLASTYGIRPAGGSSYEERRRTLLESLRTELSPSSDIGWMLQ